ncbi:MAG: hypothetical protein JWP11_3377 [Frankiales bacterium]|jgi:hypothetical protein|nr:hypothetical protein [Frankiales bacterium]
MTAWDLVVARDDLSKTRLAEVEQPAAGPGEAVLKVDRVGLTANNVTYAVLGDSMGYWKFFPAETGWGHVPLWGFADVVDTTVEGVDVGQRLFGYYPTASHLVVQPGQVTATGFRDVAEHRAGLPSPYNGYQLVDTDPAYEKDREDLQALYRPLFFTSFMLADFLGDNGFFGAQTAVLSSASSKTAYGTAFLLDGIRRVGLTSPANVAFTESLGCYDEVLTYDDVTSLPADAPTLYADMAGSRGLRAAVHEHLGDALVHDAVVGITHIEELGSGGESLAGAKPTFFFAPDQMAKRRADWGAGGLEQRYGDAWRRFVPHVEGWVDVVEGRGPQALNDVWLEVLTNKSAPRAGNVVRL